VIPLDPTAVLAVVCACVAAGAGGYLLGYLEGRDHRRREDADAEYRRRDTWRW
jgi:hypothetical protein